MVEQKLIKIWVLEDDQDDRELVQEAFMANHIEPFEMLEKAQELFDRLKGHLDVVIVDFHLKTDLEDGDRVVQKLKNECEECYAIVISTLETKKEFIRIIRARADDYIDKEDIRWPEELVKAVKIGQEKVSKVLLKKQKEDSIRSELYKYQLEIKERVYSKQNSMKHDGRSSD
jgi:DNA-binding response OmpR family regulator